MFRSFPQLRPARVAVVGALVLVTASCSDSFTSGPQDGAVGLSSFFKAITLSEFQQSIDQGPSHVEVKISADGQVATGIEVAQGHELSETEKIRARVLSVAVSEDSAALSLDLNGIQINVNRNSRFTRGDDEVGFSDFVDHLNAVVSEGNEPWVEVERPNPDAPQDPDDPTFVATAARMVDAADRAKIEINVDADNLIVNDAPPPDGWLKVLGAMFELRVSTGETELEEKHREVDKREFEDHVASVDVAAGSVTLADGTVLVLADDSEIVQGEADEDEDDHRLGSLDAIAAALADGRDVVAFGAGVVQGEEPLTLLVIEVVFKLVPPPMEEFEGIVESVNLDERSVQLVEGPKVIVASDDVIGSDDGGLATLAAVAEALAAEQTVAVVGHGTVESKEPLVIVATEAHFEVEQGEDDAAGLEDFAAAVTSANADDASILLESGVIVLFTDSTDIDQEGDIVSFDGLLEALAGGRPVRAAGVGHIESEGGPVVIAAVRIRLEIDDGEG
ncbi:MAG: hypothetical protein ACE5HT_11495 [Gemmatimonadales bacterium]